MKSFLQHRYIHIDGKIIHTGRKITLRFSQQRRIYVVEKNIPERPGSIGCAKPSSRGDRFHRSVTKNSRPRAFCHENGFKNFKRPLKKKREFDVTNSIEQCLTRTGTSGSSDGISFWVRQRIRVGERSGFRMVPRVPHHQRGAWCSVAGVVGGQGVRRMHGGSPCIGAKVYRQKTAGL